MTSATLLFFILTLLVFLLVSISTADSKRTPLIPDAIISNFVSFPRNDSYPYQDPDGIALGPDGKLYVGFFGAFVFEPEPVFKGIGRVSADGSVEVVADFPRNGGIVEEMIFGEDGYLYVCVALMFPEKNPQGLQNGIIRVDVNTGELSQFWANQVCLETKR